MVEADAEPVRVVGGGEIWSARFAGGNDGEAGAPAYALLVKIAKIGLTATLYLIGSGISIATLKQVGHRPLVQGIVLWLVVSVTSLWLIFRGWVRL